VARRPEWRRCSRAPDRTDLCALRCRTKDDLAHEALLPSLIASVVSYAMLVAFMGTAPLFAFGGTAPFSDRDLLWSALLGVICGFIAMNFTNGFRRTRNFFVNLRTSHGEAAYRWPAHRIFSFDWCTAPPAS
jgi:CIC family chloride channel protein